MRESVAQRRDMALIDNGRESTTPVEPTSGLGGEFSDSRDNSIHDNSTDNSTSRIERDSDSEEENTDNTDSNVRTTVIYNTRL